MKLIESSNPTYYFGCIVVEIRDYRYMKDENSKPKQLRLLLQLKIELLLKDIQNQINSFSNIDREAWDHYLFMVEKFIVERTNTLIDVSPDTKAFTKKMTSSQDFLHTISSLAGPELIKNRVIPKRKRQEDTTKLEPRKKRRVVIPFTFDVNDKPPPALDQFKDDENRESIEVSPIPFPQNMSAPPLKSPCSLTINDKVAILELVRSSNGVIDGRLRLTDLYKSDWFSLGNLSQVKAFIDNVTSFEKKEEDSSPQNKHKPTNQHPHPIPQQLHRAPVSQIVVRHPSSNQIPTTTFPRDPRQSN
jgi:hypothetical protein